MSIKVDILSSSSTVPVRTKSSDEVPLKQGCDAKGKVLEAEIKAEAAERKAADERLQAEIDGKQDRVKFVEITGLAGRLSPANLAILLASESNKIAREGYIYSLTVLDGHIRRYFTKTAATMLTEVAVDVTTGEYQVIRKMDPMLEEHINDRVVHITEEERRKWNNKVRAEAADENLLLVAND